MSVFRYRLQPILSIKERMEEHEKNKLGKEMRKLDQEEKKLQHIYGKQHNCFGNIVAESNQGIQAHRLQQYQCYLTDINRQLDYQTENVGKASKDVEKQREQLIEVAKEKKMLEVLREKKRHAFIYEQNKQEEKRVDELISYKYTNK